MTQIAIVQPAAPQIPPAAPPANSDKQQFSTHFEKAISDKKDQLDARENESNVNTRQNESSNPSKKLNNKEKSASAATDIAGQDSTSPAPAHADGPENVALTESAESADEQNMRNLVDALFSKEVPADTTFFSFSANNAILVENLPNAGKEAALPLARVLAQGVNGAAPQSLTELPAIPNNPAEPASATAPQIGQKPVTDALLVQLQQIINNSNEKGTVTISKVDNSLPTMNGNISPKTFNDGSSVQVPLPQPVANNSGQIQIAISSERTELDTDSPVFVLSEGFKLPTEKSDHQLTSLRHNTRQQYFEAKINLQSAGQDDSLQQDRQQGSEPGSTSTPTVAGQNSPVTPIIGEQTNTFAQSLTTVQDSPSLPASEPAKTVTLPSGTVVHEEDVIRQVLERFQITKRELNTQINIKLHPAELGELKIDLTVKEGSIRANVVAQSQHAQEIIEKNMMKLRTVLEDHGFTIDNITVTSKSDSTGDATLFDRQLFSQSDYTPQSSKRRSDSETGFRLEEAMLPPQPATTGVNVKI